MKKIILLIQALLLCVAISAQETITTNVGALNCGKNTVPAKLQVAKKSVQIQDNGNKTIEPYEFCYLTFTLQNTGKGIAYGCVAKIEPLSGEQGIECQSVALEPIQPNTTVQVKIPIMADENTVDGKFEFNFYVQEAQNNGTPKQKFSIPTQSSKVAANGVNYVALIREYTDTNPFRIWKSAERKPQVEARFEQFKNNIDIEFDTYQVWAGSKLEISADGGQTFTEVKDGLTGDIGMNQIERGKHVIHFDASKYPTNLQGENYCFRVSQIHGDKVFNVNGIEFKMIYVEGGTFKKNAGTKKERNITVGSFYIAETECLEMLWDAIMVMDEAAIAASKQTLAQQSGGTLNGLIGASIGNAMVKGLTNKAEKNINNMSSDDEAEYQALRQISVKTGVKYKDCESFIARLNDLTGEDFTMPTEAEWEFAARGGNYSKGYKFAGGDVLEEIATIYGKENQVSPFVALKDPKGTFKKTGTFAATKQPNELGIYDMTGNVTEWCLDWFDTKELTIDEVNPCKTDIKKKVIHSRIGASRFDLMKSKRKKATINMNHNAKYDQTFMFTGLRLVIAPNRQ